MGIKMINIVGVLVTMIGTVITLWYTVTQNEKDIDRMGTAGYFDDFKKHRKDQKKICTQARVGIGLVILGSAIQCIAIFLA